MSVIQFPTKPDEQPTHTIESVLSQNITNLIRLSYVIPGDDGTNAERIVMAASLLAIVVHNLEKNR
jgi:hypothetical protein